MFHLSCLPPFVLIIWCLVVLAGLLNNITPIWISPNAPLYVLSAHCAIQNGDVLLQEFANSVIGHSTHTPTACENGDHYKPGVLLIEVIWFGCVAIVLLLIGNHRFTQWEVRFFHENDNTERERTRQWCRGEAFRSAGYCAFVILICLVTYCNERTYSDTTTPDLCPPKIDLQRRLVVSTTNGHRVQNVLNKYHCSVPLIDSWNITANTTRIEWAWETTTNGQQLIDNYFLPSRLFLAGALLLTVLVGFLLCCGCFASLRDPALRSIC